jgi:hypothetical protein
MNQSEFCRDIYLSRKCLKELLKRFQMEYSTPVRIPMVVCFKLSKYDISPNVDQRTY